MDAVVAFRANGEATKTVEPGERALDDPAEHAKAAAVGRAATAVRRAPRRGFGSNGSRRAHSASSKRGCAIRDRTNRTRKYKRSVRSFETRS